MKLLGQDMWTPRAWLIRFLPLGVLLLGGTGLYPQNIPAELTSWMNRQGNSILYGMGISEINNKSIAFRQARIWGMEQLRKNLETEGAFQTEDLVNEVLETGDKKMAEAFTAKTEQLVQEWINKAYMYGPYTNNKGATYLIMYVDRNHFQRDLDELIRVYRFDMSLYILGLQLQGEG